MYQGSGCMFYLPTDSVSITRLSAGMSTPDLLHINYLKLPFALLFETETQPVHFFALSVEISSSLMISSCRRHSVPQQKRLSVNVYTSTVTVISTPPINSFYTSFLGLLLDFCVLLAVAKCSATTTHTLRHTYRLSIINLSSLVHELSSNTN